MEKRIIKHRQTSIDATILTYGRQEALFQIHEDNSELLVDNNEIMIPAIIETGSELQYDENNELYDLNIEKIRSREAVELATLAEKQVLAGSFNSSFNKSFSRT